MLQTALKALKTHQHIYVVNVHDTFDAMKARETARRQAKGKNHPSHRQTCFFSCCVEDYGDLSIVKVTGKCPLFCVYVS